MAGFSEYEKQTEAAAATVNQKLHICPRREFLQCGVYVDTE